MQSVKNTLILLKEEYDLLKKHIHSKVNTMSFENKNAVQLAKELKESIILEKKEGFPPDVVRLHSQVLVEEKTTGRQLRFKLVFPDQANLDQERISILAPLGLAVIGYRKGEMVTWEMPTGKKVFHIKDVYNS